MRPVQQIVVEGSRVSVFAAFVIGWWLGRASGHQNTPDPTVKERYDPAWAKRKR